MNIGTLLYDIFNFLNEIYQWLSNNWYIIISMSGTLVIIFVAFKIMKGLLK